MVTFIIIRHGYSQGNKEKRFSGQLDVPFGDIGVLQAKSVRNMIEEMFSGGKLDIAVIWQIK